MRVKLVGGPKDGTTIDINKAGLPYEIGIGTELGKLIYHRRGNWLDGWYYKFNREEKMEEKIKSLIGIFYSTKGNGPGNGTPIKVQQRIPCGDKGDVFCLIGIDANGKTAYGYYELRPDNLIRRTADKEQWYLYTPPAPVAHYQAIEIKKPLSRYADYRLTQTLYSSEDIARDSLGDRFVRLATEYPAVMLTPKK
jgi:hypothetical protein